MTKEKTEPVHLLLRYSDKYRGVETIKAHQDLIDLHGSVWLGKIGRPLSNANIRSLNQQIADGIPTYLYLTKRVGAGDYECHSGLMQELTTSSPNKELIPKYYEENNIPWMVKLWVKFSELKVIKKSELAEFKIASTGKGAVETFQKSVISLFMVRNHLDKKQKKPKSTGT
jgi:hypothetical protein